MITARGKETILRFIGGIESQIGGSLEVGIGSTPFNTADTKLAFPAYATNVELVGVDLPNSLIVFKGTLPESIAGTFSEMGLSYSSVEAGSTLNESTVLSAGDQAVEPWTGGQSTTNNIRLGERGIALAVNNTTSTARMLDFGFDLSSYSSLDQFSVSIHSALDVDTFRLRLMVDSNNYFQYSGPVGSGYEILTFTKSNFTVVGSPSWSSIVYMEIDSVSDGAGTLTFDAFRIDDKDYVNRDNFLVSRLVLSTPFVKAPGAPLEIEYGLVVTI